MAHIILKSSYLQDLEQENFKPELFIEKLAQRILGTNASLVFQPEVMRDAMVEVIEELNVLKVETRKKINSLESECAQEEQLFLEKVGGLGKKHQGIFHKYQDLDDRVNFIANKVIHLGDQLENVSLPRARIIEAKKLLKYFADFMSPDGLPPNSIFTDPHHVNEAATIVQKLYVISQEITSADQNGSKYDKARDRITQAYEKIETTLFEAFISAQASADVPRMRELVAILCNFKNYYRCVDAFMEQCQMGAFYRHDVFGDALTLCQKTSKTIDSIFPHPQGVYSKFIINIFQGKLNDHIQTTLEDKSNDIDAYLKNLYDLYTRTQNLCDNLVDVKLGIDSQFMSRLTKNLFGRYVENYDSVELRFLKAKFQSILEDYYTSIGFEKKPISTGGLSDLKRMINVSFGGTEPSYYGPNRGAVIGHTQQLTSNQQQQPQQQQQGPASPAIIISDEKVAKKMVEVMKVCLGRSKKLSSPQHVTSHAFTMYDALMDFLYVQHIDYGIEYESQNLLYLESGINKLNQLPEITFFRTVQQTTAISHTVVELLDEYLNPLIAGHHKKEHVAHVQRRRKLRERLEQKISAGLDKSLSIVSSWIRHILAVEQKRADFYPLDEGSHLATLAQNSGSSPSMCTTACSKVVKFVSQQLKFVRQTLDGKNLDAFLLDFGIEYHRAVLDHFLTFAYNVTGAIVAICDVNEYRVSAKSFHIPLIVSLFDGLHALTNLLVVSPENVKQVCAGDDLANMDRTMVTTFIQLRSDYKSSKLNTIFR